MIDKNKDFTEALIDRNRVAFEHDDKEVRSASGCGKVGALVRLPPSVEDIVAMVPLFKEFEKQSRWSLNSKK